MTDVATDRARVRAPLPATMRAMALTAIGGPENLAAVELPRPWPEVDEVVIAVRTVAANRQDIFTMRGAANRTSALALPHVLGIDPAGVVAGLGTGVDGFAVGDRVVVKPSISCGTCDLCVAGEDEACPRLTNVGVHRQGDVYTVIHNEDGAMLPAQVLDNLANADHLAGVHLFLSKLNHIGAALQRFPCALYVIASGNNIRISNNVRVKLQQHFRDLPGTGRDSAYTIRASLKRDYRSITGQSIPSTKAKQALSRTRRLRSVLFSCGKSGDV